VISARQKDDLPGLGANFDTLSTQTGAAVVACRHRRANSGYLPGFFSENPRPKATTALTRWESEPRLGAEMYATWVECASQNP
jgi:hypothetical protein